MEIIAKRDNDYFNDNLKCVIVCFFISIIFMSLIIWNILYKSAPITIIWFSMPIVLCVILSVYSSSYVVKIYKDTSKIIIEYDQKNNILKVHRYNNVYDIRPNEIKGLDTVKIEGPIILNRRYFPGDNYRIYFLIAVLEFKNGKFVELGPIADFGLVCERISEIINNNQMW